MNVNTIANQALKLPAAVLPDLFRTSLTVLLRIAGGYPPSDGRETTLPIITKTGSDKGGIS